MKTDIYQKLERDFGDALPLALEEIERVDVGPRDCSVTACCGR
jgi:hypothetical protein